jgi:hypothetical protein
MEPREYWQAEINDLGHIEVVDDLGLRWDEYGVEYDTLLLAHCVPRVAALIREYIARRTDLIAQLRETRSGSGESVSILDDIEELEAEYRDRVETAQDTRQAEEIA